MRKKFDFWLMTIKRTRLFSELNFSVFLGFLSVKVRLRVARLGKVMVKNEF